MKFSKKKAALFVTFFVVALVVLYTIWPTKMIDYLTKPVTSNGEIDRHLPARQASGSWPPVVRKKVPDASGQLRPSAEGDQPLVIAKKVPADEVDKAAPIAAQPAPATEAPGPASAPVKPVPAPATVEPDVTAAADAQVEKPGKVVAADATENTLRESAVPPAEAVSAEAPEKATESQMAATAAAGAERPRQDASQPEKKATMREKPASHRIEDRVSGRPYSLMLASCRMLASANQVVTDNRRKGLSPYIVRVDLGQKGVWWRVLGGTYRNADEAQRVISEQALKGAIVTKTPYAVMIGDYSDQKAAAGEVRRLEELKYSPYFVETSAQQVRLLVGAFATRKGAEKLRSELDARGISNQVVSR